MAGVKPLELQGSDGTPGILLIAYAYEQGAGFCIVEGSLYVCPLNVDGSLVQSQDATTGFEWSEVVLMSDEENEQLRPIVAALGGNYDAILATMPCR